MNNWDRVFTNFLRNIPSLEKDYQERIVSFLLSLGLGWADDEISQQYSINLGSTKRVIPDIVLSIDNKPQVIIEVKSPYHSQQEKDILQLESYMKQLEVNIGIYFGEKVEVFYKEFDGSSLLSKLLELRISATDENWKSFVNLCSRESFSQDKIFSLYTEIEKKKHVEAIAAEYLTELLSPKGSDIVKDALAGYLRELEEDDLIVESILSQIELLVIKKSEHRTILKTPQVAAVSVPDTKPTVKFTGKAEYTINDEGSYGVGRLALAIVQLVVEQNPNLSFYNLTQIFNTWRENIKSMEEIRTWKTSTNDNSKDRRWFEKDPLVSRDGISFAVSTQWGLFNIDNIIKVGREYGLRIRRVR